eukprot:c42114_g1_i1 orf=80-256(+)
MMIIIKEPVDYDTLKPNNIVSIMWRRWVRVWHKHLQRSKHDGKGELEKALGEGRKEER